MKLLLDTQLLLWTAGVSEKLPAKARAELESPENEPYLSIASLWEMAIKRGQRRRDFVVDVRVLRRRLLDNGYMELGISSEHAMMVENLPPIHKDPFDRLLVAQAMAEGFTFLTTDATLAKYPGSIRLV